MEDGLQTLDKDTYAVPETRVGSAASVRSRIDELRYNDGDRSTRRGNQQSLIDGKRPFSVEKLKNTGQGDRTNLNMREGEGMADAAKTPYYSLIFRNPRFANITSYYGDQPQRRQEWGEIESQEWQQLLEDWNGFDFQVQLKQWQMCVFGIGIPMWPDVWDWRWEARKIGDVLVPDKTPADIEKVSEAVAFRWKTPVELYQMIKKESAAKAAGWYPDRVKQAIVENRTTTIEHQFGRNWNEIYAGSLRRGDVIWNSDELRLPLADYLVQEFDGTITHVIMLDNGSVGNPTQTLADPDDASLLYKKIGRYENFSQVMCPFFFDIGTGEWHSIKGLGPKIYDFCEVSNRLTSAMIDGARNGASMILQAQDGKAQMETQLVYVNGAVVVQPGFQVQQNRFSDSLQGTLAVKRDLQNILQSNTGQYRQRESGENQEPTLGQARLNYQNQTQLNESAVDRYTKTLDRLYREMLRRALNPKLTKDQPGGKEALDFRDRCMARGVPKEALVFDQCCIKAARGVGSGSPAAVDIATRGMLELLPMAAEEGRNYILRLRTAALLGQNNVDSAFPELTQADVPDDNVWAASLENSIMRQPEGDVPPVTDKQDHVIHFTTHYQDAAQDVQGLQQGQGDPMKTLIHLHKFGPHAKVHLNKMQGDPSRKTQLAPMEQGWIMMSKIADQLQQQLEEAAKSQQPQQPHPDPAMVSAIMKVQGELGIKRQKMIGDMQLKKDKQDQTAALKDLQTAHSIRLKNIETSADLIRNPPQPAMSGNGAAT